MTDHTPTDPPVPIQSAPPQRDLRRTLVIVLQAGILVLTAILVIAAIPYYYNASHMALVIGVEVQIDPAGNAVFTTVVSGTPAAQAGILVSDVLVAMNGRPIISGTTPAQLGEQAIGWVYTPLTVSVRTGSAPPRTVAVLRTPEPGLITTRLVALGISFDYIVDFMLLMDCAVMIVYLAVALVLIRRGRHTPLRHFAVMTLVTFGASATFSVQLLAHAAGLLGWLAAVYVATGFAAAFTFFGFLYPDGQWVTRRGRILVIVVWVWTILQWLWPAARPSSWAFLGFFIVYMAMIVVMFNAQLHRYRRTATPAQRSQIKWFMLALATVMPGYAFAGIAYIVIAMMYYYPAWASPIVALIVWQVGVLGYQVPYVLIGIAIAIALLRYRLWDIDVVINRSLVYSALTATLAVVYAVALAAINAFINQTVGNTSPLLVVAITTAFPLALFNPLRGRIQNLVDSRLKPEEVSFAELSALLALEAQAQLPAHELIIALTRATARQLGLRYAATYVLAADGQLIQDYCCHNTDDLPALPAQLTLDDPTREALEEGELATAPQEAGLACLVPLTTFGIHTPDSCGVLALGPRINGKGYTTLMENGLRALGREAGKSLYVAQRREQNN